MNFLLFGAYLLCSVGGMVLFKLGMNSAAMRFTGRIMNLTLDPIALLGLLMYFCSFLLWTVILRKSQLTYGIAMLSGISYMLIMLSGFLVFKEAVTPWKLAGLAAILSGIVMLNIK